VVLQAFYVLEFAGLALRPSGVPLAYSPSLRACHLQQWRPKRLLVCSGREKCLLCQLARVFPREYLLSQFSLSSPQSQIIHVFCHFIIVKVFTFTGVVAIERVSQLLLEPVLMIIVLKTEFFCCQFFCLLTHEFSKAPLLALRSKYGQTLLSENE
jgi:hypothetical protein